MSYTRDDEVVRSDVERELARVFGEGVRALHFEEALVEAILACWVRQQRARMLAPTIGLRGGLVRRLRAHAGAWPWEWRAEHLVAWIEDLAMPPSLLHVSTLRQYQLVIRLFATTCATAGIPGGAGRCTTALRSRRAPELVASEASRSRAHVFAYGRLVETYTLKR